MPSWLVWKKGLRGPAAHVYYGVLPKSITAKNNDTLAVHEISREVASMVKAEVNGNPTMVISELVKHYPAPEVKHD
jgi:hypothetical protein